MNMNKMAKNNMWGSSSSI